MNTFVLFASNFVIWFAKSRFSRYLLSDFALTLSFVRWRLYLPLDKIF